MKKIINIIALALGAAMIANSAPAAAGAPTTDEKASMVSSCAALQTAVAAATDKDAVVADYASQNSAAVKKFYDWAMDAPADFYVWKNAIVSPNKDLITKIFIEYRKSNALEETALTFEQICFAMDCAEWWRAANMQIIKDNYASVKSNGFVVGNYKINAHTKLEWAVLASDADYVFNVPAADLSMYGLQTVLVPMETVAATLENNAANSKKIWAAYVRARKILTPQQSDAKNAALWSRLIADEDAAYVDFKRNK